MTIMIGRTLFALSLMIGAAQAQDLEIQEPTDACLIAADRMTQVMIEEATKRGLPIKLNTPERIDNHIHTTALRLQKDDLCDMVMFMSDTAIRAFARTAIRKGEK